MFQEEINALKAIYCHPGECIVHEKEITVNLKIDAHANAEHRRDVTVVINVDDDYPNTMPEFSVISDGFKRKGIADLKRKVKDSCKELIGQPVLVALVTLIQEHLEEDNIGLENVTLESTTGESTGVSYNLGTALLHIDHMRSKTKYCKTLEKWTKDLNLTGRLLFCGRLILLILQGSSQSIKDFIVRLKTTSIDVDSRGHACKEKMMSVLAEEPCKSSRISDYQVLELSDVLDLEKVFTEAGLEYMHRKYVACLK